MLPAASSPASPQARPAHGNHLGCFSKEKRMSVPALRDPVFAGPAVPTALGFACVPSDSETHHARWRATPGCRWGCGEGHLFWGLRREALLRAAFPPPKVSLVESSGTFGEHGRGWPYMARCPFTPTPRPSLQESLNPSDLSPAVCAHLRLTRSGGWVGCACGSGPHWGSSLQL